MNQELPTDELTVDPVEERNARSLHIYGLMYHAGLLQEITHYKYRTMNTYTLKHMCQLLPPDSEHPLENIPPALKYIPQFLIWADLTGLITHDTQTYQDQSDQSL